MANAVIYARFSSDSQSDGFSIEAQIHACEDFAKHNKHTIIRSYIDSAKSGTSDKREQFQNMLSDAESLDNSFDVILIYSYDRFSRNRYDHINYKQKLRFLDIDVISITQPIDPSNPDSVLLESIYEGMAESYSRKLSREVVRGLKEAASRGFWVGGVAPFGYNLETVVYEGKIKKKLVIDEEKDWIIKKIFTLYSTGKIGHRKIASEINSCQLFKKFYPQLIMNILSNRRYNGCMSWGHRKDQRKRLFRTDIPTILVENSHPKIIDDKLFKKCEKLLNSSLPAVRKTMGKTKYSNYLLGGVIKCGSCGGAYIGVSAKSGKYHYYECSQGRKTKECKARRFSVDHIDEKVKSFLKRHIFDKKMIDRVVNNIGKDNDQRYKDLDKKKNSLKRTIQKNSTKYDKLMDFITNNDDFDPSMMKEKLKNIQQQIKRDKDELNIIEEKNKITELTKMDADFFRDFFESQVQNILSNRINNETIKSLIRTITLNRDHMEIEYHLNSDLQDLGSKVLKRTSSVEGVGTFKNYLGTNTKHNTDKIFNLYNNMAIKRKVMV